MTRHLRPAGQRPSRDRLSSSPPNVPSPPLSPLPYRVSRPLRSLLFPTERPVPSPLSSSLPSVPSPPLAVPRAALPSARRPVSVTLSSPASLRLTPPSGSDQEPAAARLTQRPVTSQGGLQTSLDPGARPVLVRHQRRTGCRRPRPAELQVDHRPSRRRRAPLNDRGRLQRPRPVCSGDPGRQVTSSPARSHRTSAPCVTRRAPAAPDAAEAPPGALSRQSHFTDVTAQGRAGNPSS